MTMDLESVRMFVRVAELRSFTRAGEQMGVPKSRISLRVKDLEDQLGSRLLQRTTRAVRLTPDGEQFLTRGRALVAEADDLSTMFQATSSLTGRVRIELPIAFARDFVIPRLPDFFARHPRIDLAVSTTDRPSELVRDGFDCVVRIGALAESRLVAKKLGALSMANCASPSYVRRLGIPRAVTSLDRHELVHYTCTVGGDGASFEYPSGDRFLSRSMRTTVTVDNTDAYLVACVAGLGIIQVPRVFVGDLLRAEKLVEVLPEHTAEPMPVWLVHGYGRGVPKRVRAVMAFLVEAMEPAFA